MQPTLNQKFKINYQYPVVFSRYIFELPNQILKNTLMQLAPSAAKVLVFLDHNVDRAHPHLRNKMQAYFEIHCPHIQLITQTITGGEPIKNERKHLFHLLSKIDQQHLDRHSLIFAIGGGAVLDAVGFAAAIAHRGIPIVRFPTTVLSQNDSGVGVKNSFNDFGKKNFLGTFAPPLAVINDSTFLETLDERDWRSGISEAVKVALIKDAAFYEALVHNAEAINNRNLDAMEEIIHRCADLHVAHIGLGGDPFEKGSSRPLDFGHWAAHKIEHLSNYQIRHGEAVATGIAIDCIYAHKIGKLSGEFLQAVLNLLKNYGFQLFHPELLPHKEEWKLWEGLEEFREHLGGELTILLIKGPGKPEEVHDIQKEVLLAAIKYLQAWEGEKPETKMLINNHAS
ncbi:3-dehydroquinate synthase [Persicobacter diffluens]|uniref:3-dehydroquinate synthase n=1 Tax=Persicobacter diffluens TaxID=981 RepID=A0AAN5AIP7_9BACT|nr:3-dehydroquinate synthase [Persicobacter diffluens]